MLTVVKKSLFLCIAFLFRKHAYALPHLGFFSIFALFALLMFLRFSRVHHGTWSCPHHRTATTSCCAWWKSWKTPCLVNEASREVHEGRLKVALVFLNCLYVYGDVFVHLIQNEGYSTFSVLMLKEAFHVSIVALLANTICFTLLFEYIQFLESGCNLFRYFNIFDTSLLLFPNLDFGKNENKKLWIATEKSNVRQFIAQKISYIWFSTLVFCWAYPSSTVI